MPIKTTVSPRFDMCYALSDLVSPAPRLGTEWAGIDGQRPEWLEQATLYGAAFWLGVPDVLEDDEPPASVDELLHSLRRVSPKLARARLVRSLFHSESASKKPAAKKREWLAFIGLDEWAGKSATIAAIEKEAAPLMAGALAILEQFAETFEPVWRQIQPQLEESRRRVRRLAQACSLGEIAQQLMLRVEVDEPSHRIRALRGGFEMDYSEDTLIVLLPSAFNLRRFWTVAEESSPPTIFFPYFDPGISVPDNNSEAQCRPAELDPWLICRALGDPTRAAIIRRLARSTATAVELGADLGLSKANISHHIFQLREAGLLRERPKGRAVELSIQEDTIFRLSEAFRAELLLKK